MQLLYIKSGSVRVRDSGNRNVANRRPRRHQYLTLEVYFKVRIIDKKVRSFIVSPIKTNIKINA